MRSLKLISQDAVNTAVDVCCYFDWDWEKSGSFKPGIILYERDNPDVFEEIIKSLRLQSLSPVSDYSIR